MTGPLIEIGYNKGELELVISRDIVHLSLYEMKELRRGLLVAMGSMEQMWREGRNNPKPKPTTKANETVETNNP